MILSREYENKILDLFRGYPIEKLEKVFIGLVLENGDEVSGDSYSRIEYDTSSIAWFSTQGTVEEVSTGDTGMIANVANIDWGTALETWGTVNRVRFFKEATGPGYVCDSVIPSTLISNGDIVNILAEDFTISTRDA